MKANELLLMLENGVKEKKDTNKLTIEALDDMMFECVNEFKKKVIETVTNTLKEKDVKKNVQFVEKKTAPKNIILKRK